MKNLELYGEDWMRAIEGKKKVCNGEGIHANSDITTKKIRFKIVFCFCLVSLVAEI